MSATGVERPSSTVHCDVLVIGGGPAGSTIATLLSERGWNVTLLEKECHSRFHIGESLLPMSLPILRRLGVLEEVEQIGIVKYGAEFCTDLPGSESRTFYFANAIDKSHAHSFEVRRSEFDHLLLRNCESRGVDVRQCVRVTDVKFAEGGSQIVHARDEKDDVATWTCRFVVDASGRDTFLSRRLGLKRRNSKHNMAAIFGHFDNAERRPGRDEGNIGIYWFEHGWFWMIPLRDGVMSVGAVCWPEYLKSRRTGVDEFLWETIKLCPGVRSRMTNATLIESARATGNYSYESQRMYGNGYLLVGDAFAFVDPLFSSGVFLAMHGASLGAEVVDAHLRDPLATALGLKDMDRKVRRAIQTLSWFIYRFTSPVMRTLFVLVPNEGDKKQIAQFKRVAEAVTSMLAGDLFRHTPIRVPLTFLKAIYYVKSAGAFVQAWRSYWLRVRNARLAFDAGDAREETEL